MRGLSVESLINSATAVATKLSHSIMASRAITQVKFSPPHVCLHVNKLPLLSQSHNARLIVNLRHDKTMQLIFMLSGTQWRKLFFLFFSPSSFSFLRERPTSDKTKNIVSSFLSQTRSSRPCFNCCLVNIHLARSWRFLLHESFEENIERAEKNYSLLEWKA